MWANATLTQRAFSNQKIKGGVATTTFSTQRTHPKPYVGASVSLPTTFHAQHTCAKKTQRWVVKKTLRRHKH